MLIICHDVTVHSQLVNKSSVMGNWLVDSNNVYKSAINFHIYEVANLSISTSYVHRQCADMNHFKSGNMKTLL